MTVEYACPRHRTVADDIILADELGDNEGNSTAQGKETGFSRVVRMLLYLYSVFWCIDL